MSPSTLFDVSVAVLLLGFGYAAYRDWVAREVSDGVWILMVLVGVVIGFFEFATGSAAALVGWIAVSALVLEHFFPWDDRVGWTADWLPTAIEGVAYAGVGGVILALGFTDGFGSSGLPLATLFVFIGVVVARGLFEVRILYGGADAKALIVAGFLVPVDAFPAIGVPATAALILPDYPFAVTILLNAALAAVVVPVAIALKNVRAGEFEFPRGFVGYRIPVAELPRRFVWLKDPTLRSPTDDEPDEAETTEEDVELRTRQATDLKARGVTRVWVTPQLPFVVALAAGAVLGVVAGNLIFDLAALA